MKKKGKIYAMPDNGRHVLIPDGMNPPEGAKLFKDLDAPEGDVSSSNPDDSPRRVRRRATAEESPPSAPSGEGNGGE